MQNTKSLKSKLANVAGGILIGLAGFYSTPSFADTVYYGGEVKGKTAPAYIEYSKAFMESKYVKDIPAPNDPKYNTVIQKISDSVSTAVVEVAATTGYDVVVEKNDPPIANAKDITEPVIKQMKKNEEEKK